MDHAALDQVEEAAGCRDEDVRVLGTLGLRAESGAAVDGCDLQALRFRVGPQVLDDLRGELAGGDEDECAGAVAAGRRALDERDPEGERLARPGRGRCEDVHACEGVFEHKALHRKRCDDVALSERTHDRRTHAEGAERLRQVVRLLRSGFEMQETRITR